MESYKDWQSAITESYQHLLTYLSEHIPAMLGALALLLLGWLVSWMVSRFVASLFRLSSRLLTKTSVRVIARPFGKVNQVQVRIVQRTVFWVVMLFFIAAASASLGLDFFAESLRALLGYLPQLAAGILIMLVGYFLAGIAELMARSAAHSAHFEHAQWIARVVWWAVIFTAAVIGIEQLGINIQFITSFLIVITGVLVFGVALAFGLGSQSLVANLLAGRQLSKHLKIHDSLKIGDHEGRLIALTETTLILETDEGRLLLPARLFLESSQGLSIRSHQNGKEE